MLSLVDLEQLEQVSEYFFACLTPLLIYLILRVFLHYIQMYLSPYSQPRCTC